MRGTRLLIVLVALGLVVGAIPGGALASTAASGGETGAAMDVESNGDLTAELDGSTVTAQAGDGIEEENATEEENASRATVGQQLATVIAVTDDEVGGDVEASSLDAALENANESERAAILADRAATLRDRADAVVADQRAARTAYEDGEITRGEFAQRLAVLSGQAGTVDRGFERLDEHAADVSPLELRAADYDRAGNANARERLNRVTGSGASALLAQYTGEQTGEFSLEVDGGISIEVENDDGERSREVEREQPGNGTFEVTQSEALTAATEPLSTDLDGEWTLRSVDRDEDDGYYEFEFSFFGPETTGEAEVNVDGQTGEVFEFEEELEPRDADDDAETPLSISIVDGTADPGATVTLRVTAAGEPVEGATVELDDQEVGQTDADGRITVTLPDDDEVDIEVEAGEREGELEITLRSGDDRDADEEIRERLSASGSVDNGTVTVSVTYDGDGVSGASVYADDERVGTTDADGTVSFAAPDDDDDELEVTVVKGAFEVELEFEIGADGTLVLDDVDVDERDSDDEDHEDDDELSVTVVSGEPGPGETVVVAVTDRDGVPVEGATVEVEGEVVGTTDGDGRITVTLPDEDEAEIEVEAGDREGELELEFDEAEEADDADDGDDEELSVTIVGGDAAPGATVTLEVTDGDGPVSGAVVEVEDEVVGTTDGDGRITVTLPEDNDEAEIEVEDGDREGELEIEFSADDAESDGEDTQEDDAQEDDAEEDDDEEDDEEEDDDEDDDEDDE